MVRLTADVILNAPARISPGEDYELVLRGLKTNEIENLSLTMDSYDSIDFTDNVIEYIGNFPQLNRLRVLLLSNNRCRHADPNLGKFIPTLHTLILTNNIFNHLLDIKFLSTLKNLVCVSFLGNPVTRMPNYRFFVIYVNKNIRLIDFQHVSQKERIASAKFFASRKGKVFLSELEKSKASETSPKDQETSASTTTSTNPDELSAEESAKLQSLLEKASTNEEVEEIEKAMSEGRIKEFLQSK